MRTCTLFALMAAAVMVVPGFDLWEEADARIPEFPVIQNVADDVSLSTVRETVEVLASFKTRFVLSFRNYQAADYIYSKLRSYGLDVEYDHFICRGWPVANIVATLNGTDPTGYWLIGAHFDSINHSGSFYDADAPAPGADDNASGVAVLLAVAEALSRYRFKETIKFIAINGEELDHGVGSHHYAKMARERGDNILGFLNVDMVGYNFEYSNLDVDFNDESYELFERYVEPVNRDFGFIEHLHHIRDPMDPYSWGDNEAFWEYGFRAISFVESVYPRTDNPYFKANHHFHHSNDTPEYVNYTLVRDVAKLAAGTLVRMAVPSVPDLTVRDVALPEYILEGDMVEIPVEVKNTGNASSSAWELGLYIDGECSSAVLEPLNISETVRHTFHWNATPGNHTLRVVADPENVIGEWYENNTLSLNFTVYPRPALEVASLNASRDFIMLGEEVLISGVVHNSAPTETACTAVLTDGNTALYSQEFEIYGFSSWSLSTVLAPSTPGMLELSLHITCTPRAYLSYRMPAVSIVVDDAPEAVLDIPQVAVDTFESATFYAWNSSGVFEIAAYSYDFGDGSSTGWTESPVVRHTYTHPGEYTVTLQVRDRYGTVGTTTGNISVFNQRPSAHISYTRTYALTSEEMFFSACYSSDPENSTLEYTWNMGDGTVYSGMNISHAYRRPGVYFVMLKAVDQYGEGSTDVLEVHIQNRRPRVSIAGPDTVAAGGEAVFTWSGGDPDGEIVNVLWTVEGRQAQGNPMKHVFRAPGTYMVTITATDDSGAQARARHLIVVSGSASEEDSSSTYSALVAAGVIPVAAAALWYPLRFGPRPEERRK